MLGTTHADLSAEAIPLTVALDPDAGPLASFVRDKHYERKHGPGAYYGQG